MAEESATQVDVIVVGGGLSGLTAARKLEEGGASVVVLEARDRVGGRTWTEDHGGAKVDVGGAYIGPTQNKVLKLAKELGVEHYPVPQKGTSFMEINGKRSTFSGLIPKINPIALLDLNHLMVKVDEMAKEIPLLEPWNAKDAEKLDSMTFQQWLDDNSYSKDASVILGNAMRSLFCAEPCELSFLAILWYCHSGNGIVRLAAVENGAQERKFVVGSQALSNGLAAKLKREVIFNHPVIRITQEEGQVKVTTLNGKVFIAKRVVVAIPPALYNKIQFQPPLPPMKSQMGQRMPMGSIIKTITLYEKPFWREKNMNGSFFSDKPPVIYTLDDTKPDGSHPGIMGFVLSKSARSLSANTPEERKKAITEQYARVFGTDEALRPLKYIEKDWMAEEYSGGCYVGIMPPRFLTEFGPYLRTTHGSVHFAGTETATFWSGYMDGAIQAGEREAFNILTDFNKDPALSNRIPTPAPFSEFEPLFDELPGKSTEFSWIEKHLPSGRTAAYALSAVAVGLLGVAIQYYQQKQN